MGVIKDNISAGRHINVLLVDDKTDNLEMLCSGLKSPDYTLVTATSGLEALTLMDEMSFAVVVLDVMMPVMDGFELARRIKSNPDCADVPLIFLTAYSTDEEDIAQGYSLGAFDYLAKPVDLKVLRAKINVFVGMYKHNEAGKRLKHYLDLFAGKMGAGKHSKRTEPGSSAELPAGGFCLCDKPAEQAVIADKQKADCPFKPFCETLSKLSWAKQKLESLQEQMANLHGQNMQLKKNLQESLEKKSQLVTQLSENALQKADFLQEHVRLQQMLQRSEEEKSSLRTQIEHYVRLIEQADDEVNQWIRSETDESL